MKNIFLIFICLFFLIACKTESKISSKQVFDYNTWNKFNSLELVASIPEAAKYQTKVRFEYTSNYEYTDLKIQYELISPDGESKLSYVNIPVIDKNGKNLGKKNGEFMVVEHIISKADNFNTKGEYKIIIDNQMPKFDTENIVSLEVILEEL